VSLIAIDPGRSVTIAIAGKPMGQPRQKQAVVNGRARNYLESTHPIHGFKWDIKRAWPSDQMFDGPVRVSIIAIFARPKSATTKRGPNLRYPCTKKPDWDNIAKSICDALNGVAYRDDAQVADGRVERWIAAAGEEERTIVTVEAIEYAQESP